VTIWEADNRALLSLVGVSHEQRRIYVILRGTVATSVRDWFVDAKFRQTPWSPGPGYNDSLVHHGFLEAWLKLRPEVFPALAKALTNPGTAGYTVAISGHSLGAGLAALMTAELLAAKNNCVDGTEVPDITKRPVVINTMGQPRVGNQAFAEAFSASMLWETGGLLRYIPHRHFS